MPLRPTSEVAKIADKAANFSVNEPLSPKIGFIFSIAAVLIPLSLISFITPSSPILSSLSKATVKSMSLSLSPITSAKPLSILRLLIFIVTPFKLSAVKTASYNCTNSTSCHKLLLPTTSASHW